MMNSRLYNGDCFDVMNNIQDKSVDMILCDLPLVYLVLIQIVTL